MTRKILVTNDDGIGADGLLRLARAATAFGTVWVVAPDSQRSAASHRITLHDSIDVRRVSFPVEGVEAYETTGTPADCVRFGIPNILKSRPDLVLSGINFGFNCGTDVQYSATIGAALEAACCGVPAIALSEGFHGTHEVTDAFLDEILRDLIQKPLGGNRIWNVNFPECALRECQGILRDRQIAGNAFFQDVYREQLLPGGVRRLTVEGHYHEDAAPGTDFRAVIDHCISIGIVNNLSSPPEPFRQDCDA